MTSGHLVSELMTVFLAAVVRVSWYLPSPSNTSTSHTHTRVLLVPTVLQRCELPVAKLAHQATPGLVWVAMASVQPQMAVRPLANKWLRQEWSAVRLAAATWSAAPFANHTVQA